MRITRLRTLSTNILVGFIGILYDLYKNLFSKILIRLSGINDPADDIFFMTFDKTPSRMSV